MKKFIASVILFMTVLTTGLKAQDKDYNQKVKNYIEEYKALAITEQNRCGIPAAVTLAQGILETHAGTNLLATGANNHFGMKCKKDWTGATISIKEDDIDQCYKKYNSSEESYKDHSDRLQKLPRYASLFSLSKTDYTSWAKGLEKAGYSIKPYYAKELIKIIENYKLQAYTNEALKNNPLKEPFSGKEPGNGEKADTGAASQAADIGKIADSTHAAIMEGGKNRHGNVKNKNNDEQVKTMNGLKVFHAKKGEMLLEYAVKYNIRYARLLEINDLPDAPLPFDMYVYLEKKLTKGTHPIHIAKEGETIFIISQQEGIQLKKLIALNLLEPGEEPMAGATIHLQTEATKKPALITTVPQKKKAGVAGLSEEQKKPSEPVTKPDTVAKVPVASVPVVSVPPPPAYIETKPKTTPEVKTESPENTHTEIVQTPPPISGLSNTNENVQDTTQDDLSQLKAELDKVVYNNNKYTPPPSTPKPKTQPEPPSQKAPVANAPASKKPETKYRYYTVQKGDTAKRIARKNNITLRQLMELNNMDFDDVKKGQRLRVK